MTVFDLYGFKNKDLEEIREILENSFNIALTAHESDYKGGDYYRFTFCDDEYLELRKNIDLFDEEPAELDFPEYSILLYSYRAETPVTFHSVVNNLPHCDHLRHQKI